MGGQSLATVWPVDGLADVREGRRIHSCSFPCSGCFLNFPGVDALPGAAVPDLDLLCIPLVAASLSAGVGSLQTEADVLDYFAFRSDWLCRKGNPDKMVLMKVYGDSMEPEICHGDMALIDQSKQQIYPHTIYAVGVNEEIYIKQIETLARSSDASPQPQRALRAHRSGSARRHGRVRPHHRQGHLVVSGSVRNKEGWGKGGENF